MSSFGSKFSSRLDSIYAVHGDSAIALDEYDSIINASCLVIVDTELSNYADSGVDVSGDIAVISVRVSEIPMKPYKDHKFRVGDVTYHVDDVFKADGSEYTMTVME